MAENTLKTHRQAQTHHNTHQPRHHQPR